MGGIGKIRGERDERPVSPIVLFTGKHDAGPCEPGWPSAFCPHCGSGGRYVWSFVCQDGTTRGAMRGCLDLFAQSSLAREQLASIDRHAEACAEERAGRKGARGPTSWDKEVFGATTDLEAGRIEVREAEGRIRAALDQRRAYLSRRFGKRRR
jgi:hypothetical protein